MTIEPHRSYLSSTLSCRCPRCREGKLFKHPVSIRMNRNMEMNKECPVCGQPLNIEVGFYYGSSYVSYALTIAFSVASLIAWWLLIGFSFNDNRFFYWVAINAVLLIAGQPYYMRVARTGWLAFFVYYDKNWRTRPAQLLERINEEQEGNW